MTRKIFLIAGVAAMALAAPASGERGKDREAREQASQTQERKAQRPQRVERVQRVERPQRMERQQVQRLERPARVERQRVQRLDRPQRIERPRVEHRQVQRLDRPQRIERQRVERRQVERVERPQRIERQRIERRQVQRLDHPQRIERQRVQQADRRLERIERRATERFDRRQAVRDARAAFDRRQELHQERSDVRARFAADDDLQLTRLFRDRPMRPMKFKDDRRVIAVGERIDPVRLSSFVPTIYRTRYVDTPDYYYRYDDDLGYLYRIDRDDNFVRALIPLFGGYGIGDPWPRTYYSSYVPLGYRPYYYDTPDHYYRYDGYGIYRIDAGTQLITALVALLTGQSLGVGQMLPTSFGVYNVPMGYRSTYYDRDDAWYRYGDGFIYQVDPYDRRIEARYPIYGHDYDYLIGEPWPAAYPDYNVPYGYQSLYYDTPQYQYRFADGAIYRVDPTTQVIQALVALVSGQQFGVGQSMPLAYSTYNVPFAYRDRYYDTDDAWYRYADGYVYQVDPDSGLIEDSYPIYA